MYFVRPPFFLKWYYPDLIWNKTTAEKTVYLTFDDGPIPNVTDFVLNTLKSFNAKATFFCIGENISKHPQVFDRLKSEGHTIGNHTYNHLKGWKTDDQHYIDNFLKCQDLTQTQLFRPPYGRIKKSQIAALKSKNINLTIVMWDVLSGDFDLSLSPETCYQNVVKNVRNGSIIVFHDSLKAFDRLQYALPNALKYLTENGYQFGTL
ncbi:polysaccharide deacetylase family protein [Pedobacter sp. ASV28]|uniref:polysaccharide deacetylase family protein n=1 Tax=Pedobacter sp. ASV28 TaxID=2795123 RepID=UPI0018EAD093|nr:polysaccharide deacetylase family protein [Pedobacter sp. ASV28]